MSSSFLSRRIKRTSDLLKVGASDQVSECEERSRSLRGLYERLLSDFMVSDLDFGRAYVTAEEFFGSGRIRFAGIDRKCSRQVETLLRQGRKYGLGGCIATQRIAYLNTNALQQLHTYFVGTLPRPYDRSVVSDTFMIDQGILEKTLEFAPGEWLLSSYIATGIENAPIFIRADNAEN